MPHTLHTLCRLQYITILYNVHAVRNVPVYNTYDTSGMGGRDTVMKNDYDRYGQLLLYFAHNYVYF